MSWSMGVLNRQPHVTDNFEIFPKFMFNYVVHL